MIILKTLYLFISSFDDEKKEKNRTKTWKLCGSMWLERRTTCKICHGSMKLMRLMVDRLFLFTSIYFWGKIYLEEISFEILSFPCRHVKNLSFLVTLLSNSILLMIIISRSEYPFIDILHEWSKKYIEFHLRILMKGFSLSPNRIRRHSLTVSHYVDRTTQEKKYSIRREFVEKNIRLCLTHNKWDIFRHWTKTKSRTDADLLPSTLSHSSFVDVYGDF